jgi:hypothetical protein
MSGSEEVRLDRPREEAVRAELGRLLQSAEFRTSKRCSDFLGYVVEHTMNGPTGALKERLLGVELFQLPPDFDPGQHAIVRVTANEVRKRLAQNYLAENGAHRAVKIDLPPGSYKAEFRWEAPVPEPQPPQPLPAPEPPVPPRRGRPAVHAIVFTAVVAVALTAGFAAWRWRASGPASPAPASVPAPPPGAAPLGADVRILVGSTSPYTDRSERAWSPDRFFTGGAVHSRPSLRIFRTLDPDIYRRSREGEFHYDIPLKPGSYELRLHFAETGLADFMSLESSGEGQRLFRVAANGQTLLDMFDVVADAAGVNTADERVFRNVAPAPDGFLHLSFTQGRGTPILSGIELLPVSPGKVRPIRVRAGWPASWRDAEGQRWNADSYFLGGNALVRTTNPAQESGSSPADGALYNSERWGHFSYAVPVADGRYRVTLRFCEGHYGNRNTGVGGAGSRLFDVYCNGVALLKNFDILKQAGGEGRPLDRTFPGIQPTAQGKIVLTFVPVVSMACVNGIEIVEDAK